MTLATDIATLGTYNSTDISNAVTQAYDLLSIRYHDTLAEGTDTMWDRIAKVLAVHLLDRLNLQRKAITDNGINIPPLISKDIREMIDDLAVDQTAPADMVVTKYTDPADDSLNYWEGTS